jgi:hypothetical protein
MKKPDWKLLVGTLVTLSAIIPIIGCSSNISPSTTPPVNSPVDIQTAAGSIMENILLSVNEDDYTAFSKDFGQNAKNMINQSAFDQLYNNIQTEVGEYQSKLYVSSADQNDNITVSYIARYSREPAGVTVTLVLQAAAGGYTVEGLNFDSPNLSGLALDVNVLRTITDPETETLLTSLNKNDYSSFSKDLDQTMKNAIPQDGFDRLYNQLKSTIGNFESKEFEGASVQNNIVTTWYLAKYSGETSGVWVSVSFDSEQKIAGLHFNSPKLQQAQP